jgi:putative nucleotidyltransferase with HDIG domain
MTPAIAKLLERYFDLPYERGLIYLNRVAVSLAAALFVLVAMAIVAFEDVFPGQTGVDTLAIGDRVSDDILAPKTLQYESAVLTAQRREEAAAAVRPIYDPPDPAVARQQTDLARQILDYIDDVRQDTFSTTDQKISDIQQITSLALSELTITYILEIDNERWQDVDAEIITVLERVMRGEIKESDLARRRAELPTQVSVRFNQRESAVIEAIVRDLIRSNTTVNEEATLTEQESAANAVPVATRSFVAGQIVIPAGERVDAADYEALAILGLLDPGETRFHNVVRAFLGSTIALVVIGLYTARFRPDLFHHDPRVLILLACVFLITLLGARINGLDGQLYLYPTAALALLFVIIDGPQIAIVGVLGLALLISLMANNSLEIATLVTVGGIIGTLMLRRSERLNSFFFAGLMVAVSNIAVAALFNLGAPDSGDTTQLLTLVGYSFLNGILTATVAMAGMYVVTLVFNLPTALKLLELSQANQPLMQRLLREAPGTYQHSLQVANLSEQAANTIGANADLTRVAALYHDIGKMLNPAFFTENQRGIGNPHDVLNDPYRSADIIISHVTDGADMARQYRLPYRLRDFILEHHGTSQVYVFYKQAVILAGDDESLVEVADFTYPGPKPQSRETGVLMLADSCEAAVRSREPKTKKEIEEIVRQVIDGKRQTGQLNESYLTLNDLDQIQTIFIDMLQAIRHPRINYAEAVEKMRSGGKDEAGKTPRATPAVPVEQAKKRQLDTPTDGKKTSEVAPTPPKGTSPVQQPTQTPTAENPQTINDDDDAPVAEVPRLKRTDNGKGQPTSTNGDSKGKSSAPPQDAEEPQPKDVESDQAGE